MKRGVVISLTLLCFFTACTKKEKPHVFDPFSLAPNSEATFEEGVKKTETTHKQNLIELEEPFVYLVVNEVNHDAIESVKILSHHSTASSHDVHMEGETLFVDRNLDSHFVCDHSPCDFSKVKLLVQYNIIFNGELRQKGEAQYYLFSKEAPHITLPKALVKDIVLGWGEDIEVLYQYRYVPEKLGFKREGKKIEIEVEGQRHLIDGVDKKTIFEKSSTIEVKKKVLAPIKKEEAHKASFHYDVVSLGQTEFKTQISVVNKGLIHAIKIIE